MPSLDADVAARLAGLVNNIQITKIVNNAKAAIQSMSKEIKNVEAVARFVAY